MITEQPVTIGVQPHIALEGALAVPAGARTGVVLCHPHPLHGGDMDSPVVLTATRACADAGLATLRFNFRGTGASGGVWDDGRGEQDDIRAALAHLRRAIPGSPRVALAGYSFGAAMAATVADAGERLAGLALIAPPLAMRPWQPGRIPGVDGPVLLAAGSADEYCPRQALDTLARALPGATVAVVDGADHFWFTGLDRLAAAVTAWAKAVS